MVSNVMLTTTKPKICVLVPLLGARLCLAQLIMTFLREKELGEFDPIENTAFAPTNTQIQISAYNGGDIPFFYSNTGTHLLTDIILISTLYMARMVGMSSWGFTLRGQLRRDRKKAFVSSSKPELNLG